MTTPRAVAYAADALARAGEGHRPLWALHRALLLQGEVPVVGALSVAQVRAQPSRRYLSSFLAGVEVEPLSLEVLDAAVSRTERVSSAPAEVRLLVDLALRRHCAIVTEHPRPLLDLGAACGIELVVWSL